MSGRARESLATVERSLPRSGRRDRCDAPRRTAHFPIYAFTNSNQSHQEVWSVHLQRELAHFQSVFVSSELGLRKPELAAFSATANRTGSRLSDFLFFDDTLLNVVEAKRAGMQAVLVRSIEDVRRALASLGVEDR